MSQSSDSIQSRPERIEITLNNRSNAENETVELPFKMLVIGNFQGESDGTPLHERTPVSINRTNFNAVMYDTAPRLKATVPNLLLTTPQGDKPPELKLDIRFRAIDDFHPDQIIRLVPSLNRLFKLRELLIKLQLFPDKSRPIIDQIIRLAMN